MKFTEEEKAEFREFLREAVVAGLRDHPCRFGSNEAAVLHEAAKRLEPDDMIAVAWIARRMRRVADSAGEWAARFVFMGLVVVIVLGASVFLYLVHKGWISAPSL